jgi:predicted kinase
VPRLILLNGPPAVGKTTLARRYAVDHPGTLVLDIDVLRTMVAGWESDVVMAGQRIRTTALAAITAYLADGGDVMVPQLCGIPTEVARFEHAASAAGAAFEHVLVTAPPDEVVRRFRTRGDEHPWAAQVTTLVAQAGGDDALHDWIARLDRLDAVRVPSTDLEQTYRALLVALGDGV